jgi:hypothetical protein
MEGGLVNAILQMEKRFNTVEPLLAQAEAQNRDFALARHKKRLLLLLSFVDFNCPLCYDDLMQFCDSLTTHSSLVNEHRVLAVFRQDNSAVPFNEEKIEHWAKINHIDFPIISMPEDVFAQIGFKKSSIVILKESGDVARIARIPVGALQHKKIFELLDM